MECWMVVSLHRGVIEGYSGFWKYEDAVANAKKLIPDNELDKEFSSEQYRCTKGDEYEAYVECVTIQ